MKRIIKAIVFILMAVMLVFMISCGDKSTGDPSGSKNHSGTQNIDVYTAGYEFNAAGNWDYKVWKNDALLFTFVSGSAASIFVSGNDVYCTGSEYDQYDKRIIRVWKNNSVLYTLDYQSGWNCYATDIFVSGNDVYVTTYETKNNITYTNYAAKVWKNGTVLYNLSSDGKGLRAQGIYVSNNDIYVCGSSLNQYNKNIATVWKNGNILFTFGGVIVSGSAASCAYDIKVLGNTVYVSGNPGNSSIASVYKYEGTINKGSYSYELPVGTMNPYITPYHLDVEARAPNDVYWFFYHSSITRIFKGNSEIYALINEKINDLAVKNGNLYLAGFESESGIEKAKVWKNGEELYTLTDGTYDARAEQIFLVAR